MAETDKMLPGNSEIGNICIECGLCCDGSMFKHAGIDKSDDMIFLKQTGFESVIDHDKLFFHLPCKGQEGKRCLLYHDARRFKVCKTFQCKLLKQYLSGDITYSTAMSVIQEILVRRQSVKAFSEILHTDHHSREPSLFSFIRELYQSGKMEDPAFRKTYSKQILDCFIFRELLKRSFYKKNNVDEKKKRKKEVYIMEQKVIANPVIVLREDFDDWAILFDPDTGEGFGLDPISVLIWKQLDGKHTIDDIVANLQDVCDETPPEAVAHVTDFIATLMEKGLVGTALP